MHKYLQTKLLCLKGLIKKAYFAENVKLNVKNIKY